MSMSKQPDAQVGQLHTLRFFFNGTSCHWEMWVESRRGSCVQVHEKVFELWDDRYPQQCEPLISQLKAWGVKVTETVEAPYGLPFATEQFYLQKTPSLMRLLYEFSSVIRYTAHGL